MTPKPPQAERMSEDEFQDHTDPYTIDRRYVRLAEEAKRAREREAYLLSLLRRAQEHDNQQDQEHEWQGDLWYEVDLALYEGKAAL